jgi:hypothetical protein
MVTMPKAHSEPRLFGRSNHSGFPDWTSARVCPHGPMHKISIWPGHVCFQPLPPLLTGFWAIASCRYTKMTLLPDTYADTKLAAFALA